MQLLEPAVVEARVLYQVEKLESLLAVHPQRPALVDLGSRTGSGGRSLGRQTARGSPPRAIGDLSKRSCITFQLLVLSSGCALLVELADLTGRLRRSHNPPHRRGCPADRVAGKPGVAGRSLKATSLAAVFIPCRLIVRAGSASSRDPLRPGDTRARERRRASPLRAAGGHDRDGS